MFTTASALVQDLLTAKRDLQLNAMLKKLIDLKRSLSTTSHTFRRIETKRTHCSSCSLSVTNAEAW